MTNMLSLLVALSALAATAVLAAPQAPSAAIGTVTLTATTAADTTVSASTMSIMIGTATPSVGSAVAAADTHSDKDLPAWAIVTIVAFVMAAVTIITCFSIYFCCFRPQRDERNRLHEAALAGVGVNHPNIIIQPKSPAVGAAPLYTAKEA